MGKRGLFEKFSSRPLMIGSFGTDYAQGLKARLLESVPETVIVEKFMGPSEMANLYAQTRLNIHPCVNDSYGMTVVESASQEAPSVVHKGGGVGASDFLRSYHSELFEIDYEQELSVVVEQIEALLENAQRLQEVRRKASKRAREYDAVQNAEHLVKILSGAIPQYTSVFSLYEKHV